MVAHSDRDVVQESGRTGSGRWFDDPDSDLEARHSCSSSSLRQLLQNPQARQTRKGVTSERLLWQRSRCMYLHEKPSQKIGIEYLTTRLGASDLERHRVPIRRFQEDIVCKDLPYRQTVSDGQRNSQSPASQVRSH